MSEGKMKGLKPAKNPPPPPPFPTYNVRKASFIRIEIYDNNLNLTSAIIRISDICKVLACDHALWKSQIYVIGDRDKNPSYHCTYTVDKILEMIEG